MPEKNIQEEKRTRVQELRKMHDLAVSHREQKRFQEAFDLHKDAYENLMSILGHEDPEVYTAMHELAVDYGYLGDKEKKKTLLEQALEGFHKTLGCYDPKSRSTLWHLTGSYDSEAEYAKGEAVCQEGVELCRRHPDMAVTLASYMSYFLGWLEYYCRRQGKYAEALDINQEGLAYANSHLERSSRYIVELMEWTGCCYRRLGKYQEAYDADLQCWELERELYGETDKRTVDQKQYLDRDAKELEELSEFQPGFCGSETKPEQPAGKTLNCWQSYQSGFMIETPSVTLIFDWYKGQLPYIRKDKPLHIFISHRHTDHFNPKILSLVDNYKDVSVYLGYDHSSGSFNDYLEELPEKTSDAISCFYGENILNTEFGTVRSLISTDQGVAFLVEVDGMTLYHAGDLFPWGIDETRFLKFITPLKGVHIDYAMLPLDPHFPDNAERCIYHYLKLADITYFTPMHLWNRPEFASIFAWQNPRYSLKMIAVNPQGARIYRSIELLRPYMIQYDVQG